MMKEKLNRLKEELAARLEKNEDTVSNWCHPKDLSAVAKLLGVDACEFLVSRD